MAAITMEGRRWTEPRVRALRRLATGQKRGSTIDSETSINCSTAEWLVAEGLAESGDWDGRTWGYTITPAGTEVLGTLDALAVSIGANR